MPDLNLLVAHAEQASWGARKPVAALVARAGAVQVTTPEENDAAGQVAREVKAENIRLTDRQMELTRPLTDAAATVRDTFRPLLKDLGDAEEHLKGVMLAFRNAEKARVGREMAEAESRMARALEEGRVTDAEVEMADMALIPEVSRPPAGTGMTARWKGEVVDMEALLRAIKEGELPMEAIKPQQAVINGYARMKRVEGTFAGIRVSRDESIAVSGRK